MQCPGKEAIVPVTTGSLRLTSLNLALRGLTGQMTYLHLFNFSSLIGMNTHNHFAMSLLSKPVIFTGTFSFFSKSEVNKIRSTYQYRLNEIKF